MFATDGENWIAASTAATSATSDMTTRIKPRQKANTVDKPTMPMTIRSNAVIARFATSFCRHHASITRCIEAGRLSIGNFAGRVRTDTHAAHGALIRLQGFGKGGKSRALELGRKGGRGLRIGKRCQLHDK